MGTILWLVLATLAGGLIANLFFADVLLYPIMTGSIIGLIVALIVRFVRFGTGEMIEGGFDAFDGFDSD